MNIEDFVKIIKTLGEGAFGVTYLVQNDYNEMLAMKAIDVVKSTQQHVNINDIKKEIDTLRRLSSMPNCYPYIVCYHDFIRGNLYGKDVMAIFSDYIEGPTLTKYMEELNGKPLQASKLIEYMRQLLEALARIHQYGYAHRDIKSDNIIYDSKKDRMVVIDFGLACSNVCSGSAGSPLWWPPELFDTRPPNSILASQKHDIWSLGLILYALANLQPPTKEEALDEADLQRIVNGPFIPSHHSDSKINAVIDRMLTKNWRYRPTASETLSYLQ